MEATASRSDAMRLESAERSLDLRSPAVMGILNVTPDSFSDGGRYTDTSAAVERALAMVEEGARIVDVGGESTRPGAAPVEIRDELARVLPVIEGIRAHSEVFISIDTIKPEVMRAACEAGADLINDVMGLRAEGAVEALRDTGTAACLMHMQGEPRTMQRAPRYDDVVAEVSAFLHARVAACVDAGVPRARLCVDPGFGFGKTLEHNLALMRALARLAPEDTPLLIGVSRKSMFARLLGCDDMAARINGSVAAAFWAATQGARIIRTHDVRETHQVLTLAGALGADRPTPQAG